MTQRSHIISGVWLPGMLLSIPKVAMHMAGLFAIGETENNFYFHQSGHNLNYR